MNTRFPRPIRLPRLATLALALPLAAALAAEVPRPEHPRPDAFRENWITLNGEWQFEIDEKDDGLDRGLSAGHDLASKITVPFCPESKLSGLAHTEMMRHVWYRRSLVVPAAMEGQRVRLHFGAVDSDCWVYLNGQLVGSHIGGNVSFAFEITRFLKPGPNDLVVRVLDDTASGRQPTGKQTHTVSEGCVYTRTTGMWQPVWLEAVGSSFVEEFTLVPDLDRSRLHIEAQINGGTDGLALTAEVLADGKPAGSDTRPACWRDNRLVIDLKDKRVWSPESPFLYDLKLTLRQGDKVVDTVKSYFGLRKVSIRGRAILLNDKPVFQRLILDQGFYPDGIWTAPTDEALKHDIEMSMAAGFNGARLHQKVFEPRFLYWADKLGYLVWGEFPNWGFNYHPENYSRYVNEWTEVLRRDRNHPAIVGWCPFNESGQGAVEIQGLVWHQTKAIDPTRPLLETSGWVHGLTDSEVRDDHDYNQDPASFKSRWLDFFARGDGGVVVPPRYGAPSRGRDLGVPFMVSEFGGIGWGTEGGWGYGNGPKSEEEFYTRYAGLMAALLDNPDLFGFCYTQLTDVEQERNGLYYYDRRPKFDLKKLHDATARPAAYEKTGPLAATPQARPATEWVVLLGGVPDGDLCKPWRRTTEKPAEGWNQEKFDDSGWTEELGAFGTIGNARTEWRTPDIWLRRAFDWDGVDWKTAALVIFHDETTEVFLNGKQIWHRGGFNTGYESFEVTKALKESLKKGRNTVAVHTHQTAGGQFIDMALLVAP